MEKDNVLSFSQDADFLLDCAERSAKKQDSFGHLRYLRMAMEQGSDEAALLLAEQHSLFFSHTASDRILYRLIRKNAMPAYGYYIAGLNALGMGRRGTARAALEHYLELEPYGEQAEHAEELLDDKCIPPERLSREKTLEDAAFEALMAGSTKNAERIAARMRNRDAAGLVRGACRLSEGEPAEALRFLEPVLKHNTYPVYAPLLAALAAFRLNRIQDAYSFFTLVLPDSGNMTQLSLLAETCMIPGLGGFLEELLSGEDAEVLSCSADALMLRMKRAARKNDRALYEKLEGSLRRVDPEAKLREGILFSPEQIALRPFLLRTVHEDLKARAGEPF